jgi:hypothetical protein
LLHFEGVQDLVSGDTNRTVVLFDRDTFESAFKVIGSGGNVLGKEAMKQSWNTLCSELDLKKSDIPLVDTTLFANTIAELSITGSAQTLLYIVRIKTLCFYFFETKPK